MWAAKITGQLTWLIQMKSVSDILFLEELPWVTVRYTASLTEKEGVPVKGPPIHPYWIALYPKGFDPAKDCLCVLAYVNHTICTIKPKLCSKIVNHCNVMIITVRGHLGPLYLMNTYSDENGSAIWYIKDHLRAFPELGYMGGNFNCPSSSTTMSGLWMPKCRGCSKQSPSHKKCVAAAKWRHTV
jgi:hypothetical protein